MATATRVHLTPDQKAQFILPSISKESADKASELLQKNHENFHIFFNQSGFHNHIVHHLLTLFALGATPAELQKGYDDNASYQRQPVPVEEKIVQDMSNRENFAKYLGDEKYYHDFLVFFQKEIDSVGWEQVLHDYVFRGDERADDMFVRMFAGFLHPIIHLGFGVEFEQPVIIAEALAEAAVHENWIGAIFYDAEKAAKSNQPKEDQRKTIVQLLEEIQQDSKLSKAAHFDDGNKIRDGILKRAPEEMIKYASQYVVKEGELDEKVAEMINANVYFTSAAQDPSHAIKFDFYLIHCLNSSIFFPPLLRQPWLPDASRRRLLEWKVRADLSLYASRGCPSLHLDEVTKYPPAKPWTNIFERARRLSDDGHSSKVIRALANGERVSKDWNGKVGFVIKDDMWLKLGNMAMDSVEAGGPTWVRSCGFKEAWDEVPERETARL